MLPTFTPLAWARNTGIYEVNTRQYTPEGTFNAFRKHLPRLADMGVGVLWFMPVTPISLQQRKGSLGSYYACSDYTAVNPEFGTPADFQAVVEEAHRLGMKVIIDWVANHTGWDHRWTQEHPDHYKRNANGAFYDAHGWEDVIDLDYTKPAMRASMIESMDHWVKKHDIDGFRCDMAMLTPVDFWLQARKSLDARKPLFWLAELDPWDDEAYMDVFDAAYTWKWLHASREFLQPWHRSMQQLDSVLTHYKAIGPKSKLLALFTSNHDENSWNGTEYERYGDMALPLAAFSCTWPGLPLIYTGQELPVHKRLQFFDRDPIEWTEPVALHGFYRKLLNLRKTHPAFLSDALNRLATSHDSQVFSFLRQADDHQVLVMLNFSEYGHWDFHVRDPRVGGMFTELFSGAEQDFSQNTNVDLKPWDVKVWVK